MNNADSPAVPVQNASRYYPGLTKREAFAMAAMQGLLSSQESSIVFYFHGDQDNTIARMAVNHANNLLAELARVQP
jgi:hypothetical protein